MQSLYFMQSILWKKKTVDPNRSIVLVTVFEFKRDLEIAGELSSVEVTGSIIIIIIISLGWQESMDRFFG